MKKIFSCFMFLVACSYAAEQSVSLRVIESDGKSNFKEKADKILQLENLAGSNDLKYLKFINKNKSGAHFYIELQKDDNQKKCLILGTNFALGLFGYEEIELLTNANIFSISTQYGTLLKNIAIEGESVYEINLDHTNGIIPFPKVKKVEIE